MDGVSLMAVIAAPAVGSFLGVVIERVPTGRSAFVGRSACPYCGHALAPRDLVPLASWIIQRGRCRYCGVALGAFYPLVELSALAIALLTIVILHDAPALVLLASLFLGWDLLALAWIDARHLLLPDGLTLPLLPAGLLVSWIVAPEHLSGHLIGAVAGGTAFWLLAAGYRRLRGAEGLGGGDIKLMAAAGAWVSWDGLPSVVLLASLSGLIVAAARAMRTRTLDGRAVLPFGPFIAIGCFAVWLLGPLRFG